jgi:hypothetical protein
MFNTTPRRRGSQRTRAYRLRWNCTNRRSRLKTKDTIRITWRETPEAEFEILQDAFPRNVATAFSSVISRAFPPLNLTRVVDLRKVGSKSFLIVGGHRDSHRAVLGWMLNCCTGKGVQPFPFFSERSYFNNAMAYLSASQLEIAYLQNYLMERLNRIAAKQVHSEDVEVIYSTIEGPAPLKDWVCESIGKAIWEKRLIARPVYEDLRRKPGFEEFKAGVGEVIDRLRAEWEASPEYQQSVATKREDRREYWREQQRQRAEDRAQRHLEFLQREEKRQQKDIKKLAKDHNIDAADVRVREFGYTFTTTGRVVNRGTNGHQKRVQLSLADLDVSAAAFRPPLSPQFRAARPAFQNRHVSSNDQKKVADTAQTPSSAASPTPVSSRTPPKPGSTKQQTAGNGGKNGGAKGNGKA